MAGIEHIDKSRSSIIQPCTDRGCAKIHMSNMHHYGCQCFGCTHEIQQLKQVK